MYEVDGSKSGVSVGNEIVYKQNLVALAKHVFSQHKVDVLSLCKRVDDGCVALFHGAWLCLLDVDDRKPHLQTHHNGRSDAACLYRHYLCYSAVGKHGGNLLADAVHKLRIYLVVDETVNF